MILRLGQMFLVSFLLCVPVQRNTNYLTKQRSCSRPQSSIVRQLLHKLWKPIFKRYGVKMNRQCPLHVNRDLFSEQEYNKLYYRADFWRCRLCGKAFHKHIYLDLHMSRRHKDVVLQNDDAVCLSNYCDIFRCKNYLPSNHSFTDEDLDALIDTKELDAIYPDSPERADPQNELIPLQPPELLDILELEQLRSRPLKPKHSSFKRAASMDPMPSSHDSEEIHSQTRARSNNNADDNIKGAIPDEELVVDVKAEGEEEMLVRRGTKKRGFREELRLIFDSMEEYVEGIRHDRERTTKEGGRDDEDEKEIWRPPEDEDPEDCDPAQMELLQNECQDLISQCLSPLILQMDNNDFKNMQARLNRTLCWYLTCDRYYWHFPLDGGSGSKQRGSMSTLDGITWGFFILLFLSLSFFLVFAYYLVWICF